MLAQNLQQRCAGGLMPFKLAPVERRSHEARTAPEPLLSSGNGTGPRPRDRDRCDPRARHLNFGYRYAVGHLMGACHRGGLSSVVKFLIGPSSYGEIGTG